MSAPFLTADAQRHGVSRFRLRADDIVRLGAGLYAQNSTVVTEAGMVAALSRKHPDSVASGVTAARLLNVPLPGPLGDWMPGERIHLACRPNASRSSTSVQWERTLVAETDVVRLQLSSVLPAAVHPSDRWRFEVAAMARPRLWVSLCRVLPLDWRIAVADHLLREPRPWAGDAHWQPHATAETLTALLDRLAGYRGAGSARAAAADARVGADSPQETRLRLALQWAGLPSPELNPRLRISADGSWIEPDLFYPDFGVIVEYDGRPHFEGDAPSQGQNRSLRLRRSGYCDVHIFRSDLAMTRVGMPDAEVRARLAASGAVAVVAKELLHRGWRPTRAVQARLLRIAPGLLQGLERGNRT